MPPMPHWGYLLAGEGAVTFSHPRWGHSSSSRASAPPALPVFMVLAPVPGANEEGSGSGFCNRPQITALWVPPPSGGAGFVQSETMLPAWGSPRLGSHCHRWPSMAHHRSKGHVSFPSEHDSQGAHLTSKHSHFGKQRKWKRRVIVSLGPDTLMFKISFGAPAHLPFFFFFLPFATFHLFALFLFFHSFFFFKFKCGWHTMSH